MCVCVCRWFWWLGGKVEGWRWKMASLRVSPHARMDCGRMLRGFCSWERRGGTLSASFGGSRTSQSGCLKWADQSWRYVGFCTQWREWTHRATVPWVGFLSDCGCCCCWNKCLVRCHSTLVCASSLAEVNFPNTRTVRGSQKIVCYWFCCIAEKCGLCGTKHFF